MSARVSFRVSGRVQGVSYRASAQELATRLGLRGWVRNDASGDVEGVVEGERARVEDFLAWCARGPRGARVDSLTRADAPSTEPFARFEIRR